MLGNPKYKIGDIVEFKCLDDDIIRVGVIAIVDRFGTFEYTDDVSYDILDKENKMLYKHFPEDTIIRKTAEIDEAEVWD